MSLWLWAVAAHVPWKPLLAINTAFLFYIAVAKPGSPASAASHPSPAKIPDPSAAPLATARSSVWLWWVVIFILVVLLYLPSLGANFVHTDWTHRVTTSPVTSVGALGYFFVTPQADGFVRPLTFISLWVDNRLFGASLWAYHLQNIGIHAANAVLAGMLASAMGFSSWTNRCTALLFGAGATRFEAVIWPGARFDLLATFFCLVSLILLLRYWRAERGAPWYGMAVILAYTLAVLSKESGYSLVLIVPALMASYRVWGLPPIAKKRGLALFLALAVGTVALLAMRFALFGDIGGYPAQGGKSAQFAFGIRTVYLFFRNALAGSVFGLNAIPHSAWPLLIMIAFSFALMAIAWLFCGADRRQVLALLALTLLTAAPVVNLIGWLNIGFENSRYIYWPSLWMCMLLALVLENTRHRTLLAFAFLTIQAAGTFWNVSVYRDLSEKAGRIAGQAKHDAEQSRASAVEFLNVGNSEDGVFAFGTELEARTTALLPRAYVQTCWEACPSSGNGRTLIYRWDEGTRRMTPVAGK